MSRFLFVTPPLSGHVNPTVSVAAELTARGHECAWVGHATALRRAVPQGAVVFELDDSLPDDILRGVAARITAARGLSRLKLLWEDFFVPLARAMLPAVELAVDAYLPDALIVDQQTLAGALVARRRDLPWATFATTSAGLVEPLTELPKVRAWLDEIHAGVQREAGLPVVLPGDLSPRLVVGFTTRELLGDAPLPPQVELVGPSFARRVETVSFPWEALDRERPAVLISLGTVNAEVGGRFLTEAMAAVAELPIQAIVVAPEAVIPAPPANVIRRDFVPQLALLERVSAVVCHAGYNTVAESLAHGVPLVVAPIKDDQPIVAEEVVRAGAGVRVKFGRVKADSLRSAIEQVLGDERIREAAARVRRSFEQAGGPARAASLVEALS